MKIAVHTLASSATLEIDARAAGMDSLHAIVGSGCGCVLKSDASPGGIGPRRHAPPLAASLGGER